ncbi:MAG: hypothetical protein FWE13_03135 [Firmicutes bacterium]|nr:hypothetical protein [Bacillota bacterium]
MKREQKRQYIELEKRLEQQHRPLRENQLELTASDFKGGELKPSAFARLKEECWYIPYEEQVEIKLPATNIERFKECLDFLASRELSKLKKDRKEAFIHALVFFFVGIAILGVLSLCLLFWEAFAETTFLPELLTIISWAFVWASVTILFIDWKKRRDQRFTLLQLLSATII